MSYALRATLEDALSRTSRRWQAFKVRPRNGLVPALTHTSAVDVLEQVP